MSAFFQDMRARGLGDPLLVVSDGAPGIIKAIETCFPRSARHCSTASRGQGLQGGRLARVPGAGPCRLPGAVTGDCPRPGGRPGPDMGERVSDRGDLLPG